MAQNIRGDVIWALRGQSGGQTVHEIATRILLGRKNKYSESKIVAVLDILSNGGTVQKTENTGHALYTWIAQGN